MNFHKFFRTVFSLGLSLSVLAGCDRTARNKIISGTDASAVVGEAAAVQAVEDVWALSKTGSSLSNTGLALTAPGASLAPDGTVVMPAPGVAQAHNVAQCQSIIRSGGFIFSGDGYYTYSRGLGGNFRGIFKIGFLQSNAPKDICLDGVSVDGIGLKVAGTVGFGNTVNLDLKFTNLNLTPTLNGTISGSASGQMFQMKFTDCAYAALGRATPTSGKWTGSFGSGTTGVWLFTINFSAAGGSGTMIGGTGTNYKINITPNGVLTITT
ncbi:MAG: hypothetical protein ACT4O3_06905 [Elusimicrobiota bacterium]